MIITDIGGYEAMKPQIETKLTITHTHDPMTTEQAKDQIFCGDEEYLAEDQKRFDAFLADMWYFLGISVEVEIHNWSTGNNLKFRSSGVWGIESDSDTDYFLVIAREQLASLQAEFPQLKDLKVDETTKIKFDYL